MLLLEKTSRDVCKNNKKSKIIEICEIPQFYFRRQLMVFLCNLLNIRPVCFTFSTISFPIKHAISKGCIRKDDEQIARQHFAYFCEIRLVISLISNSSLFCKIISGRFAKWVSCCRNFLGQLSDFPVFLEGNLRFVAWSRSLARESFIRLNPLLFRIGVIWAWHAYTQ